MRQLAWEAELPCDADFTVMIAGAVHDDLHIDNESPAIRKRYVNQSDQLVVRSQDLTCGTLSHSGAASRTSAAQTISCRAKDVDRSPMARS
jgi:hypothetical protein